MYSPSAEMAPESITVRTGTYRDLSNGPETNADPVGAAQYVLTFSEAVDAGAAFVKTGTGWAPTCATLENVSLIKSTVGDRAEVGETTFGVFGVGETARAVTCVIEVDPPNRVRVSLSKIRCFQFRR